MNQCGKAAVRVLDYDLRSQVESSLHHGSLVGSLEPVKTSLPSLPSQGGCEDKREERRMM